MRKARLKALQEKTNQYRQKSAISTDSDVRSLENNEEKLENETENEKCQVEDTKSSCVMCVIQ